MVRRIHHVAAPLLFVLGVGFTFTPFGCGSPVPPAAPMSADADLTRKLRSCAEEHQRNLGPTPQSIGFDVHLDENGAVDSIAVRETTLDYLSLEVCMVRALRSLTVDDLPLRSSESSGPQRSVAPESRGSLGQIETLPLEACLASPPCALAFGLFVGASFLAVTVYVYVNSQSLVHAQARTLAMSRWKERCIAHYAACMETRVSGEPGNHWQHTRCAACLAVCRLPDGEREWPKSVGNGSCEYNKPGWGP